MNNFQEDSFGCQFCDYESRHFIKLIKHLKYNHDIHRDFKVTCGIDECRKKYMMVRKLVDHIRCKHKKFAEVHLQLRRNLQGVPNTAAMADNDQDSENNEEQSDTEHGEGEEEHEQIQVDYKQLVSNLFVEAREKYKISGKACEFVGQKMKAIMERNSHDLSSRVSTVCRREGVDLPLINEIVRECMDDQLSEVVGKYSIPHSFEQLIKGSPNFIEPETVQLGKKRDDQSKFDTYQYVPILQTLRALLQHDDILAQVFQGHKSRNERISSFTDAKLYNDSEFFRQHPNALQIVLYYDDFKVANPLRNRGEYKLGGFYFQLGNLEPKYRSKQHIVQIACLCKASDLKHYGLEVVLARLITDLKVLETDGIEFYHDDQKIHLYGTVVLVVGDNLAQHFMGGFPENFSTSLRLCRFCTGTNQLVKASCTESDFTWRTQEGYNEQVDTVKVQPQLASVYGVKKSSPLNQLNNFHVVGSMPSDIAHDLFEGGVVSVRLADIICALVHDHHFSLKLLNERIKTFEYAACDSSNPIPPLPEQIAQFKIKSTIAETWLLMRMLPLLIGDKVTEGNEDWELYLKLADMVDWICARSYGPGDIIYMEDVITEFYESFQDIYDVDLKPKEHFTLHYPKQTELFGPLSACGCTNLWERKHNVLKQIANRSKNRKNICLTLAMRHQFGQYLYFERDQLLDLDVEYVKGKSVATNELSSDEQAVLPPLMDQDHIFKADSCIVNGVKYTSKCAVMLSYENDQYQFGKIRCVFHANGTDFLHCTVLQTTRFNRHYHAFEVAESPTSILVAVDKLLDYHPLGIYKKGSVSLIILKYIVTNTAA